MQSELIERHIRDAVTEALCESRVVGLLGARQVGKSTLARQIAAHEHPSTFITLDDAPTLASAKSDPVGFVAGLPGPTIIDEIQRAPDLLLAIKQRVDVDDTPGQFLITGSANLMTLPTVQDALPGRVDYLTMRPFSQGELRGRRETFIDGALNGRPPQIVDAQVGRAPYAPMLVTGGYPEAQRRGTPGRRLFFASYVESMLGRDLPDVAPRIADPTGIGRLLRLLATRSSGLLNLQGLGRDLGIDGKTASAHLQILERLFLVHRLPPWHVNLGAREVKAPKIAIADSGLLAALVGANERRIQSDPRTAGPLFESFVVAELLRQTGWHDDPPSLFHYRDKAQREVDVVLERPSGEVAAIEVKSAATVGSDDFRALRMLRDRLGDRFRSGIVLYTGARTLPFGERLFAVPLCGLWA